MAAVTTPTERPAELRRSNSLESDEFDLQTALESLIRRMLEANRTRSFEGSTDDRADIEGWAGTFISTFQKFPVDLTPGSYEENLRTPVPEKPEENGGPRRYGLKRKRSRAVNIEALKKRCKGFQEACKALTAANQKLQQSKDTAVTECERLTEENKELREEATATTTDSEHLTGELATLWETFEAEKKRADDAEKERDEVRGMIAKKRREFEEEKLQHEALVWELDVYKTIWQDPSSALAIKRASKLADEFNMYKEEEENILQEIQEFVRYGPPDISSKTSSKHEANDSEPTLESLNCRIADQRTQITLLEMRLAKANAERVANVDQAILNLGFQLDDALEKLQTAYMDRTAADIARDEALARVEKLETKIRMFTRSAGGSKQASAFSAMTLSGMTQVSRALGNIKEEVEEEEGTGKKAGGDSGAGMGGRSLAAELEDHPDDVYSDVTTRISLDSQDDYILEKYNTLVMDNARLVEDGARLQHQIQHLEDQGNRMNGARTLILRNDGRVSRVRIQELEKLISSQLTFHQDIRALLASTKVISIQLQDTEAGILQQLEMPRETKAKVEALLEKISESRGDDVDIQEAREVIGQALQLVGEAGGMKLERKWFEFNKESGKLVKFVEDTRDRLQDGARRLGIKRPEAPDDTMAEALATSVDTYLSFVLVPLGHPRLFRTILTSLRLFLKTHMGPYFYVTTFILAALWALAGAPPAHFPRLRARDIWRVFWHVAVLFLLQTYISLTRERSLWLYANASVTSAYLHDLQAGMCPWWSWVADPRLMVFGPEIWQYYQRSLPEQSSPVGGW